MACKPKPRQQAFQLGGGTLERLALGMHIKHTRPWQDAVGSTAALASACETAEHVLSTLGTCEALALSRYYPVVARPTAQSSMIAGAMLG